MTALAYGLIGLLMISGIVFIVEQAAAWIWCPKELPPFTLVLPLRGDVENVEQLVHYYINYLMWKTPVQNWKLLLLDEGISQETRERCVYLTREKVNVFLVTKKELEQQF